jgi:hypothetical protein
MKRQRDLLGLALAALVTIACILVVDRPVAAWSNAILFNTGVARLCELFLRPLDLILLGGGVVSGLALLWRSFRRAPPWIDRLLDGALAAACALALALVLKLSLGRSQVYPSFLRDHLYTFHLLHGSPNAAFPSATMAGAGAALRGMGVRLGVVALILLGLAAALIATSGHWLSDIVAGTYAGSVIGALVHQRALRRIAA